MPPKKHARKAPASAPPPERITRRKGSSGGALAEDALDGSGAQAELEKETEDRQYWEQYATPLLASWLADYPETALKPVQMNDRDVIISLMVKEGAKRPRGNKALRTMQSVWMKQNGDDQPAPGYVGTSASLSEALNVPPKRLLQTPLPTQRSGSKPHAPRERSSSPERDESHMRDTSPLPLHFPPRSRALAPRPVQCMTCLASHLHTECDLSPGDKPAWLCVCGLRGDLPIEHPVNRHFVEMKTLALRSRLDTNSSSSSSSSSAATGQAAASAAAGIAPLDKELDRLAAAGKDFALFQSTAPITHPVAIATTRKALAASATEEPSEQLIKLIRSGKLASVGYAIPRALSSRAQANDTVASFEVTAGGGIVAKSKSTEAPPVDSLQKFVGALVSGILPALIDRPEAMMQWMALTRTLLEVERRYNWATAATYLDQLLHERVSQQRGFAELSPQIMETLQYASRPAAAAAPLAQRPAAGTANCNQWNFSLEGCAHSGCRFVHACPFKDRGCVDTSPTHRGKDCSFRPPRSGSVGAASRGGRGGRGGSSGRGGRDTNSLATNSVAAKETKA